MLGEAVSMLMPQVVGFRLTGSLPEGATATDLVLTVTQQLRKAGVVGKFVEYFGHGLVGLPARRSRDDREHVARVRRDLWVLPRGRRDAQVPAPDGTRRATRRARRGVLQGERALARPGPPARVLAGARARPLAGRAVACRAAPAAGPRPAAGRQGILSRQSWRASASTTATSTTRRWPSPFRRAIPRRPSTPGTAHRCGVQSDRGQRGRRRRAAGPRHRGARRRAVRARPRVGRDRGDHVVHEHVEPAGDDRRRPDGEEGGRARSAAEAVGEVQPRAGLEGRDGVLRPGGPDEVPRRAGLPDRRVRLHDLHRQLGPVAGADLEGGRRERPRRVLGSLGEQELRGAHPSRGEGELPRVADARRRVRARGQDGRRPHRRAAGAGPGRERRLPARSLADRGRDSGDDHARRPRGDVLPDLRRRLHRRSRVARAPDSRGRPLRLGSRRRRTCGSRRTSRGCHGSPRPSRTSTARAASSCSATR